MTEQILGGRYRIVRHVARGGMAEVYLGHDQLLDRPVAVKVLVPDLAGDSTFVERFRREAQAAAGLNHHNIVSVYDFGQDDGAHFIVMEYVDGPTLREIIRRDAPLPPARVIEIGSEISAGLAAAHQQGIVHRDMKPANVLMAESSMGQAGSVKVADFGIARAAQSAREGLTMPGAVVGTASYLSPEQALGEHVDHRSDVYSLGMVLYEMLAGRPPFTGGSPVAVAYKQVNETPPPPSVYNSDVPPALDAIVLRAMAKDPAARQQTAEALRADLLAMRFGPGGEEPTAGAFGTPVATAAATAVGDPGATAVVAGPATSMMAPPTGVDVGGRGRSVPPVAYGAGGPRRDPGVYRRRQVVVLALVLLAAVVLIALISASGGGDRGSATVTVPSVVGQGVNDAVAAVDRLGLKPRIEVKVDLDGEPDRVAEQEPLGGATARKGDTVRLILPAGSTETSVTTSPTTEAPTTTDAPTTTATTPTTQAPATTTATSPPTTPPPTVPTTPPTTIEVTVPSV